MALDIQCWAYYTNGKFKMQRKSSSYVKHERVLRFTQEDDISRLFLNVKSNTIFSSLTLSLPHYETFVRIVHVCFSGGTRRVDQPNICSFSFPSWLVKKNRYTSSWEVSEQIHHCFITKILARLAHCQLSQSELAGKSEQVFQFYKFVFYVLNLK